MLVFLPGPLVPRNIKGSQIYGEGVHHNESKWLSADLFYEIKCDIIYRIIVARMR